MNRLISHFLRVRTASPNLVKSAPECSEHHRVRAWYGSPSCRVCHSRLCVLCISMPRFESVGISRTAPLYRTLTTRNPRNGVEQLRVQARSNVSTHAHEAGPEEVSPLSVRNRKRHSSLPSWRMSLRDASLRSMPGALPDSTTPSKFAGERPKRRKMPQVKEKPQSADICLQRRVQNACANRLTVNSRLSNGSSHDEQLDALLIALKNAAKDDGDHTSAALFDLAHSGNLGHGGAHRKARAAALKALRQVVLG